LLNCLLLNEEAEYPPSLHRLADGGFPVFGGGIGIALTRPPSGNSWQEHQPEPPLLLMNNKGASTPF
jgi:hypothetical protein